MGNESFINQSLKVSLYKENVLVYAAGFVQRQLIKHINCDLCCNHLRKSLNIANFTLFLSFHFYRW